MYFVHMHKAGWSKAFMDESLRKAGNNRQEVQNCNKSKPNSIFTSKKQPEGGRPLSMREPGRVKQSFLVSVIFVFVNASSSFKA